MYVPRSHGFRGLNGSLEFRHALLPSPLVCVVPVGLQAIGSDNSSSTESAAFSVHSLACLCGTKATDRVVRQASSKL